MERSYAFTRYLSAKKSVDDRALNGHVRDTLAGALAGREELSVMEVGAGIGTMAERLHAWQLLPAGTRYTAVDNQAQNTALAEQRLRPLQDEIALELETIDIFDFIVREQGRRHWDLLLAHAFLDLVDLGTALPQLISLLEPGGYFYFTINFDGETILSPTIDPALDEAIITQYHQTMDSRTIDGRVSGCSRTGRRLFAQLPAAGAEILDAGSSDWVVYAQEAQYQADEAYFLHFIVDTIAGALRGSPHFERSYFEAWIAQRHAQIDAGTLVYIAHQLDFFGRRAL